jgi:hypothetical protein
MTILAIRLAEMENKIEEITNHAIEQQDVRLFDLAIELREAAAEMGLRFRARDPFFPVKSLGLRNPVLDRLQ